MTATAYHRTMGFRPTRVLISATGAVGGSVFAAPFVTGGHVYGFSAWAAVIVGQIVAGVLNSILFLIPALAIWLTTRKRWPAPCSVAIIAWCVSYFGLLWLLLLKVCCE